MKNSIFIRRSRSSGNIRKLRGYVVEQDNGTMKILTQTQEFVLTNSEYVTIDNNISKKYLPKDLLAKALQGSDVSQYVLDNGDESFSLIDSETFGAEISAELGADYTFTSESSIHIYRNNGIENIMISSAENVPGEEYFMKAECSFLLQYYDNEDSLVDLRNNKFYIELNSPTYHTVSPGDIRLTVRIFSLVDVATV